ncbi:MAG TPA: metalloregulator ArsR/SmtB family transcription factor [Gemmatimonadales bacterium]|nr:metalloregulator ArsR/SmtB family transcription factor [Gemmatimonadales bacterium]
MHAFNILGDPVRRRILELLANGERSAGDVGAAVQKEFGITQPAVSQQLRILRDNGFATVRPVGTQRLYSVDPRPLRDVADWLERNRRHWQESFDSLDAHLAEVQGKRVRPRVVHRASRISRRK